MNDNKPNTYTIELIGSYAARCIDTGTVNDQTNRRNAGTTRSPIPASARDLIAAGHNPETLMYIVRKREKAEGYMPIFTRDSSLRVWAAKDCVETETTSVRIGKYNPPPAVRAAMQDQMAA